MTDSPSRPLASFVVLNWHDEATTARCVASLRSVRGVRDCEIVVVDNDSSPASRRALAGLEGARVVPLEGNMGFTGGMNAGIAACAGRYVALLNNDLVVGPEWLEEGLRCLEKPGTGIVGGASFAWDGSEGPCQEEGAMALTWVDPDRGFAMLGPAPRSERPMACIDGSNLLASCQLLRQLGGFDPDYFAYYEDVDLCARAWALGHAVVFNPAMKVWHRRGGSSDRVPRQRAFWAARNQMFTVAKHFPERTWRRTVLRLTADGLSCALLGHRGGLRSPHPPMLTRDQRLGMAWASLWAPAHYLRLRAKRADALSSGQHDEGYLARLRSLQASLAF